MEWGAPRHKDTESATKGELHQFDSQCVSNKNPIQNGGFLRVHKYRRKIFICLIIKSTFTSHTLHKKTLTLHIHYSIIASTNILSMKVILQDY